MIKYKKAQEGKVLWFVVILVVVFVFAYLLLHIMGKGAGTLNNVFAKCSGVGGGVWTKERCNPSVSVESPVVPRTKGYFCCIPLPGRRGDFEKAYAKDFELDINKNGIKTSGSDTSTGSNSDESIQFVLNGKEITQAKTTIYTQGMEANGNILSDDKQNFKVSQNIKDISKCMIIIRPAIVKEINGVSKLVSDKSAKNTVYEVNKTLNPCEDSISLKNVKLLLLKDLAKYKTPGFYKWDFIYWKKGSKEKDGDGSATAYITISAGGGTNKLSNDFILRPKNIGTTKKDLIRSANKNHLTCYFSVAVNSDDSKLVVPKTSTYKIYSGSKQSDSKQNIDSFGQTVNLKKGESVTFTFSQEGISKSQKTITFSFEDCDIVQYISPNLYDSDYASCQNLLCDYNRKSCNLETSRNPSNACTEKLEHCYWDWSFLGGTCSNCNKDVNYCTKYNKKSTCESNQCLADSVTNRCFYQSGNCLACDLNEPCTKYDNKKDCLADACHFGTFTDEHCIWKSKKCVTTK